jgi:hypothetical protein
MRPRSSPPADEWTFESKVHFGRGRKGRKYLRDGAAPSQPEVLGAVPRVARLLALAHRYRDLVDSGGVKDYADLARIVGVSRARITQLMNLLHLAPEIQEAVLDLPLTVRGRDVLFEGNLRPIAATPEWSKQRAQWRELTKRTGARRSA